MADEHPIDTNRITPRDVEPDANTPAGRARRDRDVGHDRGRRRDPDVEEAEGGDIGGVAGGSIDGNVSGLGGDRNRR
jgi:hypothetical protein